ncbi:MAG: pilus assembly protein PilP [Bdellovibrionales bacterium]|nr:pilus assembly protein PilP [Bdellovibrionales bacterium]
MKMILALFLLPSLSLAQDKVVSESDSQVQETASPLQEIETPPLVTDIIEKFQYSAAGKRDPFKPFAVIKPVELSANIQGPVLPLQKYSIEQLQLVGIIWGGAKPMAMVIDTTKKVFYVRENDKIGNNNGYVAKIREGEIIVIEMLLDENGKANYVTRVMKINKNIN